MPLGDQIILFLSYKLYAGHPGSQFGISGLFVIFLRAQPWGRIQDFFLGGGTHVCIRKPAGHLGGGGLHSLLRSDPVMHSPIRYNPNSGVDLVHS